MSQTLGLKKRSLVLVLVVFSCGLLLSSLVSCSSASLTGRTGKKTEDEKTGPEKQAPEMEYESHTEVSPLEATSLLDFLIVVDNSSSMIPYQKALSEQLTTLVDTLGTDGNKVDWQIAVTSTTPSSIPPKKVSKDTIDKNKAYYGEKGLWNEEEFQETCREYNPSKEEYTCEITHRKCVEHNSENEVILITSKQYKENKDATIEKFKGLVNLGTQDAGLYNLTGGRSSTGYEEGLYKILEALNLVNNSTYTEVKKLENKKYNHYNDQHLALEQTECTKWHRDGASLVIILLSDEDQCSFNHTPEAFSNNCVKPGTDFVGDWGQFKKTINPVSLSNFMSIPNESDRYTSEDALKSTEGYKTFNTQKICVSGLDGENLSWSKKSSGNCMDLTSISLENYNVSSEDRCINRGSKQPSKSANASAWVDNKEIEDQYTYDFMFGEANCPAYYTTKDGLKYRTKEESPEATIPSSATMGMTTRSSSYKIFQDYMQVLINKKAQMKQNVRMYGIIWPESTNLNEYYNIPRSYTYQKAINNLNGSYYDITKADEKGENATTAYENLMQEISDDIEENVLQPTFLSNLPDHITKVQLGTQKNGKFVSQKELSPDEYEVIGGSIVFKDPNIFANKLYTHIQVDYQVAKLKEN